MKKTETLYKALLRKRVVTTADIIKIARDVVNKDVTLNYIHKKYMSGMIKEEKMVRVKRGLYIVLEPLETPEKFSYDRFLISSKLRKKYYLGFHTALEFYGCAHSAFNTVYICINRKNRFKNFTFRKTAFKPVYTDQVELGVKRHNYLSHIITVSTKERTFIDCLNRTKYAGGWGECLKSLEGLSGVNFNKLLEIADSFDNDLLYRKTGIILQKLKDISIYYQDVDDTILQFFMDRSGSTPRYLEKHVPSYFNHEWNMYVPKNFDDYFRGI